MPLNRITTMDNKIMYVGLLLTSAQTSVIGKDAFKRIGYFEVALDPNRKFKNGRTEDKDFERQFWRNHNIKLV